MKKKDIQQFKTKSFSELMKDLTDYREKLRKLNFDLAQGKVKNIKEIQELKKIIARILTIINSKTNKD
ncbi:50S ribosomal protein L29 [Candidatus Wolfebacteria bacterium]|nr:50S ribosomal protein L29 [Candidatus Wolfebacteria bacterium]